MSLSCERINYLPSLVSSMVREAAKDSCTIQFFVFNITCWMFALAKMNFSLIQLRYVYDVENGGGAECVDQHNWYLCCSFQGVKSIIEY